jgi:hypothetical protein
MMRVHFTQLGAAALTRKHAPAARAAGRMPTLWKCSRRLQLTDMIA